MEMSNFCTPEEFKVVDPLKQYKETSWMHVLPDAGLPEGTFIFLDVAELDCWWIRFRTKNQKWFRLYLCGNRDHGDLN
jgi:hypothetical protein